MGKMFLMCGLSGAGKTTFAKKFAEENGYKYLAIDDYYKYQQAQGWDNPWEDPDLSFNTWMRFFKDIHEAERGYYDVVIDTNAPTFVKRAQFIDWFPTFDEHNLIYIDANRDLRRRNNASRNRVVPDEEMERMEKEFEAPGWYSTTTGVAYIEGGDREIWDGIFYFTNESNVLTQHTTVNL